jgi:hypothetical protein
MGSQTLKYSHVLKGQWREMVFLTISLYPRYRIRIRNFFLILANFGFFLRIRRVRQDFSTTYEDFIGSILQTCEMASYCILEPYEKKMQLKFLACLTEKFHYAYSPYALNELYLALNQ